MIRKVRLAALIICLLLVCLSPGMVQAGNGLTVLASSAEVNFPAVLSFRLSAESDANITDIRLKYRVDHMGFAQVTSEVYIEFVPATSVEAGWNWDMRKTGGLPPGSSVEYWWTVDDAGGNKIETEPVKVSFDDNRYDWNELTEGWVTIFWYDGEVPFAQEVMLAAQQALTRLYEDTGAMLEKPVNIYIYADARGLQESMIFPREWTGGVAFTRYGTIAIGIAPDSLEWGRKAIAHELTHLVIHQMTFNPYGDLPTWLDEGLAMHAEGKLEPALAAFLSNSVAENNLISVRSLASPFSAFAEESALAYVQSHSLVEFLIDAYGQDKMFRLLSVFKQGSEYDKALVKVYGFDMDGLDTLWRDYITADTLPVQSADEGISPVMIGILVAIGAGLILVLILFIKKRV
ncbi:peptidase MA family metallohydrolase [Chloroflexota bacterium]